MLSGKSKVFLVTGEVADKFDMISKQKIFELGWAKEESCLFVGVALFYLFLHYEVEMRKIGRFFFWAIFAEWTWALIRNIVSGDKLAVGWELVSSLTERWAGISISIIVDCYRMKLFWQYSYFLVLFFLTLFVTCILHFNFKGFGLGYLS